MDTELKASTKYFAKDSSKLINNAVFEKPWKMWENTEISSLQQQQDID